MTKASSFLERVVLLAALGVAVPVLLAFFTPTAALAAGGRRVGVDVSGPSAGSIRSAVAGVLKHHGYEVSPVDLSGDSEDAIASAARKGKLAAVVVGEVRDGGKRAKLRVYSAGGELIGEGSWTEHGGPKKLTAAVDRTLWARIGGALSKAKAGEAEAREKPAKAPKADRAEKAENAEKAEKKDEEKAESDEKPTYSRSEESTGAGDEEASSRRKDKDKDKDKKKKKKAKVEAEAEAEAEADEGDGGAAGPALTALELGVGGRFITRTLTWANANARGYSMGIAPALGVTLAWYPAAHFRGGWPSNIGLAVSAEYLPGYESKTSDGIHYPTQENDYWAGLRGRLPLGPVEGSLTLGGGQHAFVFRSGSAATANRSNLADLPDVSYTYARAGADFRIALPAKLSLALGGGYRYVFSGGDKNYLIQAPAFFPGAKISGFDAGASLGYRIFSILEARAGFDVRRYAITTNATGMQLAVPSGTDQTLGFWVQAVILLDGVQGGAGAASHEAAPAPAKSADKDEEPGEKGGQKSDAKDGEKSGDDE